jgi:hypothetical protein
LNAKNLSDGELLSIEDALFATSKGLGALFEFNKFK